MDTQVVEKLSNNSFCKKHAGKYSHPTTVTHRKRGRSPIGEGAGE